MSQLSSIILKTLSEKVHTYQATKSELFELASHLSEESNKRELSKDESALLEMSRKNLHTMFNIA